MIKVLYTLFISLGFASVYAQGPFITVSSSGKDNPAGLFVYRFVGGKLELIEKSDLVKSTGYHNFHPTKPLLYAVGNNKVYAFSMDPQTGHLTLLNEQDSKGNGPAYVSVDKSGKFVLVANYSGATVSVLPIKSDGRLGEAVDIEKHEGSSIDTTRQKESHPHLIMAAPGNRFVLVPDLGTDRVVIYEFNAATGALTKKNDGKTLPGSGPRHLDFHPSLPFVFVLNELNSSVTSFEWDGTEGKMHQIATYPLLHSDYQEANTGADIHVTSNGRFLYASNRGHNSLAAFRINPDGTLSFLSRFPSGGETPRNFFITPDDQYLLIANQRSHNILVHQLNAKTGNLEVLGTYTDIPGAQCIKMWR